jgi:hypothetical protein
MKLTVSILEPQHHTQINKSGDQNRVLSTAAFEHADGQVAYPLPAQKRAVNLPVLLP